jgi:hypothetical protein
MTHEEERRLLVYLVASVGAFLVGMIIDGVFTYLTGGF